MLFERKNRRVLLTESGVLFLEETRQILQDVDRAALLARTGRGPGTDIIKVGFGYWTDLSRLCTAIKRFGDSHPAVHVELHTMSVPNQIAALREGRLDVGFVRPPVTDPELNSESLLSESFVVAVPKTHRLAKEKHIQLSALKEQHFVMPPRTELPFFYDLTLKLFHDAGFVPRIRHEVGYPTMVLGLVGTGVGISLVPESIRNIQSAGVVFVPLQPSSRILETVLAWRKHKGSPAMSRFLEIVRDVASSRRADRIRLSQ